MGAIPLIAAGIGAAGSIGAAAISSGSKGSSDSYDGGSATSAALVKQAEENAKLAREQFNFGKDLYSYGTQGYQKYTTPILDEFMRILGFGGSVPRQAAGSTMVTSSPAPYEVSPMALPWGTSLTPFLKSLDSKTLWSHADPYANAAGRTKKYLDTQTGKMANYPTVAELAGMSPTDLVAQYGQPPEKELWDHFGNTMVSMKNPEYSLWLKDIISDQRTNELIQQALGKVAPQQITYRQDAGSGGRYVSPMESHMFQLPVWAAKQQEAQSRNALRDITGLGPVSGVLGEREIGRATEEMIATGAFGQVTNMINAALSGGTTAYQTGVAGYGASAGAGTQLLNSAGQLYGAAGNIETTLAQLQAQTAADEAKASGSLWGGILGSIGSLGGMAAAKYGTSAGSFGGGTAIGESVTYSPLGY